MLNIPNNMTLSVNESVIMRELAKEEGSRTRVYICTAGHPTVGIGHNLDAMPIDRIIGRSFRATGKITEEEVAIIFWKDLEIVLTGIQKNFPWFSTLPDYQQYVMISLVFNMGISGLLKFKNTLKSWKSGDIEGVVRGLIDSAWYGQVGNRSSKLVNILESKKI